MGVATVGVAVVFAGAVLLADGAALRLRRVAAPAAGLELEGCVLSDAAFLGIIRLLLVILRGIEQPPQEAWKLNEGV